MELLKPASPRPLTPALPPYSGEGRTAAAPTFAPWKSARITDTGRPMGKAFRMGDRVYYREGEHLRGLACVHLFASGILGEGARRWLVMPQLRGATNDWKTDVPDAQQKKLSSQWNALEPKHAGYLEGTRVPKRTWGLDFALADSNPEVSGPGWQGDTVAVLHAPPDIRGIVEAAVFKNPPVKQSPEQDEADGLDLAIHEAREFQIKADLVNAYWPHCSAKDWLRGLDEMEGIAHVLTIGEVEGYYGEDAVPRYNRENDYAMMRRRGFGKLVDQWEKTDL